MSSRLLPFASDYLPRGITVTNQGVVIQPDLGISLSLYQGTGFINNFSLTLETWNNVATDTQRARSGGSMKVGSRKAVTRHDVRGTL